jgi:type II secretory pathway component PulF
MNESLGVFNLVMLALPALALKIAVRIMYGRRSFVAADPLKILLTVSSTVLLVLAAVGFLVGLAGPTTSPMMFLIVWVPALLIIGVILLMALDRYRRGEHRALVWTLVSAARCGVPLPEAARAFADETQDDTGARALVLAQSLEQGMPLSTAASTARLRMAAPMRVAIRVGETLGMLGPAMRQQLDDSTDTDAALRTVIARLYYLCAVVLILTGIMMFVMLRIVPVFQKMFQEFGLELPVMTKVVINVSNWYVHYGWFMSAPVTLALALLALAGTVWGGLYFIGWFPRDLPVVWRLFKRYDGALVMRGLALAVRRQVPIHHALQLLVDAYPIRRVGLLLAGVTAKSQKGSSWQTSLAATGLISRADAAVLAAAERADNLPWALEEMADSAIRRQAYRLQLALHCLYPVAVFVLGSVVAFFVIGLFLPLVSLIQGLS